MSFDVRPTPPGPAAPYGPAQPVRAYDATGRSTGTQAAPSTTSARFSRVYELEEARRRQDVGPARMPGDRIPEDVWDEVDAAAQLFENLHADGRRMVFDTDRLSGRVVASLLDADGSTTPVPLTDAVDPSAGHGAA